MARTLRYFTYYWDKKTCRWQKEDASGKPFRHTASNQLRERGVEPGDFVYGWSFSGGKLFLLGRMQVDRFVSQREADALYKDMGWVAWEANDHVIAQSGAATPMHFNRVVPPSLIGQLTFLGSTGQVTPPKFFAKGQVNPQTFRGVRQLTRKAALLLDELIDESSASPDAPSVVTVESDLDSIRAEEQFEEGGKSSRYTNYYERDANLRVAVIRRHGTVCKVCGFDFKRVYGERGAGYIEVHHLRQMGTLKKRTVVNPEKDMTVLCSNCHRMIHRQKDNVLSVEQLSDVIKQSRVRAPKPAL